jgi:hypothetical protein
MDPVGVFSARTDPKRDESRFGAIVHSHPNMPPIPVRTDLVETEIPGVLSQIVGFSPPLEFRTWRLVYDSHGVAVRIHEIPVTCCDATKGARFEFLKLAVHNRGWREIPRKGHHEQLSN